MLQNHSREAAAGPDLANNEVDDHIRRIGGPSAVFTRAGDLIVHAGDEETFIRGPNTFIPFAFLLRHFTSPALTISLMVLVGVFVKEVSVFSMIGFGGFRHAAESLRHALLGTRGPGGITLGRVCQM